ncbi:MAG TPA: hypothetical protein VIJ94_11720 [Caulobacteraceae bacterium]
MNREQSRSARRSARLDRRRGPAVAVAYDAGSFEAGSAPSLRRKAVWAFTLVAVLGAALAFWRIAPSDQHGEGIAVSVPAASTPAAAEGPSSAQS